jgi:hypothetical protein
MKIVQLIKLKPMSGEHVQKNILEEENQIHLDIKAMLNRITPHDLK